MRWGPLVQRAGLALGACLGFAATSGDLQTSRGGVRVAPLRSPHGPPMAVAELLSVKEPWEGMKMIGNWGTGTKPGFFSHFLIPCGQSPWLRQASLNWLRGQCTGRKAGLEA